MTPLMPGRRAAEEFAGVLDGSRPDLADRYAELTGCVELLERHDQVTPRPEFVADLRSRLMDAADALLLPAGAEQDPVIPLGADPESPAQSSRERRRERWIGTVAIALVLVGGSAGVATAAGGSLPGDTLYPIKRSLESARVTLNPSTTGKGSDLLGQADTRLREVGSLVSEHRTDRIDQALEDFRTSAAKGSDLLLAAYQRDRDATDLGELREFAATQMKQLQTTSALAPASTQDSFAAAAALLADIDQQASTLCGTCGGSLLEIPHALLASASALGDLLSIPATPGEGPDMEVPTAASELATTAQSVADSLPRTPAPLAPPVAAGGPVTVPGGGTSGGNAGDSAKTGGKGGSGVLGDNQVTEPVKKATNAVTGGVGQTLGLVDGLTGGMTAPLTGTLTNTVDTLVNTILGAGASNATGGKAGTGGK